MLRLPNRRVGREARGAGDMFVQRVYVREEASNGVSKLCHHATTLVLL